MNTLANTALLQAIGLGRLDPRTGKLLLQPADYTLHGGERVAVSGASGSGKSVFLRALALLDAASTGSLLYQGQVIERGQIPAYRSQVCYIPQKAAMLDGSVEDNLRYPYTLAVHRNARYQPEQALALAAEVGKSGAFLQQAASELSGGEAQIVALLRVLQLQPQVLLLDEPTAALDPTSAARVEQLVQAWFEQAPQARGYLWISHDPAQAARVGDLQLKVSAGAVSLGQAQAAPA